jgi:DNA-binding MarR family transcriptional regulator
MTDAGPQDAPEGPRDAPEGPPDTPEDGGLHPSAELEDVVHQRARLGILAILAEAGTAEFTYLGSRLGLTNGNLSRHLAVLEEAGMVAVEKRFHGRRPKTWLTITSGGRAALRREIATLRAIVDGLPLP